MYIVINCFDAVSDQVLIHQQVDIGLLGMIHVNNVVLLTVKRIVLTAKIK